MQWYKRKQFGLKKIWHNKYKEMATERLLKTELKELPRDKSSNLQSLLMISLLTYLNIFICSHSRKSV